VQVWLFIFERYNKEMVAAIKNNKYAMASMIKHMRSRRWKAIRMKYSTSVDSLDGDAKIANSSIGSLLFRNASLRGSEDATIGAENYANAQQELERACLQNFKDIVDNTADQCEIVFESGNYTSSSSVTDAVESSACEGNWSRCRFVSSNTVESSQAKDKEKNAGPGWYFSGLLSFSNLSACCKEDIVAANAHGPAAVSNFTNLQALRRQSIQYGLLEPGSAVESIIEQLRIGFDLPNASSNDFDGDYYKVLYDRSQAENIPSATDSEVYHSVAHYRARKTSNRSDFGFRGNGSLRSCYVEVQAHMDNESAQWAATVLMYLVVTHKPSGRRLAFGRMRWFNTPETKGDARKMVAKVISRNNSIAESVNVQAVKDLEIMAKNTFPECDAFQYRYSAGMPFRMASGNINMDFLGHRISPDHWIDVGAFISKLCVAPLVTLVPNIALNNSQKSTSSCVFTFWRSKKPFGHI
jgi:hypothetical protein